MTTATATHVNAPVRAPRPATIGAVHREQTGFRVPAAARVVKNIVWLAVVSMTLATVALIVGFIDIFITADLVPLVLGAGFASITFSVLGLTDRLSGR